MNILAIDTATEQCSVAITAGEEMWSREVPTARGHADMILTMIDEVMAVSKMQLSQIDGLAFGRGPGSFTGVRIAVSVIQGLALARQLRVAGISNLAAVAQQAATIRKLPLDSTILVCMDARMHEVYWGQYRVGSDGLVVVLGDEQVSPPSAIGFMSAVSVGVGTGWRAYPELTERYPKLQVDDGMLPRAVEIARLGLAEFKAGRVTTASNAQPVYLRDQVVSK